MATTTLTPPKQETPAETMLRVGTQNLANTGQFTPTPVTGAVTRQGDASTLPSGFGADLTGKVFRYDASGGLAASAPPASAAPSGLASSTSGTGGTTYAQWKATGGGSSPAVSQVPGIMSQEQYTAKYGGNVDEAAIRESVRQRMQAQIDAVNSAYDAMSREQSRINQGNLGATRAVTARSGTLGSDFGNASMSGQEQANAKALAAIEAQRALETSKLYGEVDATAEADILRKRQEAKDQAAGYSAYLDSERQKALDYAKTLGASGLSLDELKANDPNGIANIMKATGYSEQALGAVLDLGRIAMAKEKAAVAGDKDAVNKSRDDARATVKLLWDQFGSQAFKSLPADERRKYEKLAEFPAGTLDVAAETLGERKVGVSEDAQSLKEKTADKGRYRSIPATKYHGTLTLDTQTGVYMDQNGKAVPDSVVKAGGAAAPSGPSGSGTAYSPAPPANADEASAQRVLAGLSAALDPVGTFGGNAPLSALEGSPEPTTFTPRKYTSAEKNLLGRLGIGSDAAAAYYLTSPSAFRTWYTTNRPDAGGPVTAAFLKEQAKKWQEEVAAKSNKSSDGWKDQPLF